VDAPYYHLCTFVAGIHVSFSSHHGSRLSDEMVSMSMNIFVPCNNNKEGYAMAVRTLKEDAPLLKELIFDDAGEPWRYYKTPLNHSHLSFEFPWYGSSPSTFAWIYARWSQFTLWGRCQEWL
jgi:hypothetical protein